MLGGSAQGNKENNSLSGQWTTFKVFFRQRRMCRGSERISKMLKRFSMQP
ncbi:unnamed protein product [Brassica oleracea var. botrytis]|uniref:(rape) hypothetical protein n=1 Tax=Brassica napus TaxID=3708 RepID=A0A816KL49_BRANA|nr:unnamed protein product [Brassica napus]